MPIIAQEDVEVEGLERNLYFQSYFGISYYYKHKQFVKRSAISNTSFPRETLEQFGPRWPNIRVRRPHTT